MTTTVEGVFSILENIWNSKIRLESWMEFKIKFL